MLTLRLPGKRALSLRWRVVHRHLICFIATHQLDPILGRSSRELALVLGPSTPYFRWLTILRGQRVSLRPDTPRAV
jgi:hypothetical protein